MRSTASTGSSTVAPTSPIPSTGSAATARRAISRWPASAPPRSRSAAWRACCGRSMRCSGRWGGRPDASCDGSIPGATRKRSAPSRIAGHAAPTSSHFSGSSGGCSKRTDRSRRASSRGTIRTPRTWPAPSIAFRSVRWRPTASRTSTARAREAAAAARFPPVGAAPRRGVGYFFPRPSKGSACKRFNLYLRWMVRRDRLDVGAWHGVRPARLIVPLDVHIIRVGQCLGLTRYRSPGLPMAREITASLRRLDPDDPVKYDFALCHIGMLDRCGFREPRGNADCPLNDWCRPRRRRPRQSRPPSARR